MVYEKRNSPLHAQTCPCRGPQREGPFPDSPLKDSLETGRGKPPFRGRMRHYSYLVIFVQRAFAAFLAISLRFLAESLSALALPPFKPPSLPRVTAAGFFPSVGSPVAWATICAASTFGSVLDRFGIPSSCQIGPRLSSPALDSKIQTDPLPFSMPWQAASGVPRGLTRKAIGDSVNFW